MYSYQTGLFPAYALFVFVFMGVRFFLKVHLVSHFLQHNTMLFKCFSVLFIIVFMLVCDYVLYCFDASDMLYVFQIRNLYFSFVVSFTFKVLYGYTIVSIGVPSVCDCLHICFRYCPECAGVLFCMWFGLLFCVVMIRVVVFPVVVFRHAFAVCELNT